MIHCNEITVRIKQKKNLLKSQGTVKRLFETDLIGTFISILKMESLYRGQVKHFKMIGYSKDDLRLKWILYYLIRI